MKCRLILRLSLILEKKMTVKCLSIAGFDGSGGAGLQADLKTFSAFGCYSMSVLTALPVQNTCGVKNCYKLPLISIKQQLETIFEDIIPDGIKIGMLFSTEIINCVADFLQQHASNTPIVVDPVMIAKSGHNLLQPEAITTVKKRILPLATLVTPNLPEAQALTSNSSNNSHHNMEEIAEQLLKIGTKAVLIKGGHCHGSNSDDLLLDHHRQPIYLSAKRISSNNTHGTGCTLSAAICAGLSMGLTLEQSCRISKQYLSQAINAAQHQSIGNGHGPVHHFYHLWPTLDKITEQ